jgi:hypothetical protein
VIVVINVVAQAVLGERVQQEANAWMPGAAARMQPDDAGMLVIGIVMKIAIGVVLVWLYAAARPRLGVGQAAAVPVAIAAWVLGAIFFSDFPLTGMMSWATYLGLEAFQLAAFVAAALAGAWAYRE